MANKHVTGAARQRIQEPLSTVTTDMVMLSTNEPKKSVEDKILI